MLCRNIFLELETKVLGSLKNDFKATSANKFHQQESKEDEGLLFQARAFALGQITWEPYVAAYKDFLIFALLEKFIVLLLTPLIVTLFFASCWEIWKIIFTCIYVKKKFVLVKQIGTASAYS